MKAPRDPSEPLFPIRPNEPVCQYYMKHGTCKFGQACKFHHPPQSSLPAATLVGSNTMFISRGNEGGSLPQHILLNGSDQGSSTMMLQFLPQRPDEPDCLYFLRHGSCKYGATCRYHHPVNHQQRKAEVQRRPQQQVVQLPAHLGSDGSLQFVQTQQTYPPNSRVVSTSGGQHMLVTETPIHVMSVSNGSYQQGNVHGDGNDFGQSPGTQMGPGIGGMSQDHASSSSSIASSFDAEYMNQTQGWNRPKRSFSGGSLKAFGEAQQVRQQPMHAPSRVVSDSSMNTRQHDNRRLRAASFGSMGSASDNSAYHDGVVGWSGANGQLAVHQERHVDGAYSYEQSRRQHQRVDLYDARQGGREEYPQQRQPQESQIRSIHRPGPTRQRQSGDHVDQGLSMMTSALLNMLDTPEEAAAKSYPSRISSSSTLNNASPSMTPRSGNMQSPQYVVPVLSEQMMPQAANQSNIYPPDFRNQVMYKPIEHSNDEDAGRSSGYGYVSSKPLDHPYNTTMDNYQHGDPRSVSSQWSQTWHSPQPASQNGAGKNVLQHHPPNGPPSPETNVGLFLP